MNDADHDQGELTDEALAQLLGTASPASVDRRVEEQRRVGEFYRRLMELTPKTFVTPTIVAANVAVFVVMVACGVGFLNPDTESLVRWGANYGPGTTGGQWWRLFTSAFLHIGAIHLAFNMYVLWSAGHFVERLVGNVGFVVLYVISGLTGSLASVAWNPFVVSAGASGAIFGVFGALLGFVLLRRDSIPMHALAALRNSVLTFLAYNVFIGLAIPQIDMMAHLGGLAGGFVCGLLMSQRLAAEAIAGRRVRNLLAVVAGTAGIAAGIHFMPKDIPDLAAMEQQTRDAYNAAVGRCQAGQISEADVAEVIERDVLPKWQAASERLTAMKNLPEKYAFLREYVQTCRSAWELRMEAIRENDPVKSAKSDQAFKDAYAIAQRSGR